MWRRVSLNEFAAAMRREPRTRKASPAPLHTEAFTEASLVLAVALSLAMIAEYVARAMGWA